MSEDGRAELDISLEQLSMLFTLMGWKYDTGKDLEPPTPQMLSAMISHMAGLLEQSGKSNAYTNIGRLYVYKDEEMPSYYCIGLEIGLIPKQRS